MQPALAGWAPRALLPLGRLPARASARTAPLAPAVARSTGAVKGEWCPKLPNLPIVGKGPAEKPLPTFQVRTHPHARSTGPRGYSLSLNTCTTAAPGRAFTLAPSPPHALTCKLLCAGPRDGRWRH